MNHFEFSSIIENLYKLDNIKQWSEKNTYNKEESVNSHSYKVVFFTQMILKSTFFKQENNNTVMRFSLECINKAILHDWDESILLRDLSHELKYNDFNGIELRTLLDNYVDHVVTKEFSKYMELFPMFEKGISGGNDLVRALVKVADWLAMYCFLKREVMMGNKTLNDCCVTVVNGIVESAAHCRQLLWSGFTDDIVDLMDFKFIDFLMDFDISYLIVEKK